MRGFPLAALTCALLVGCSPTVRPTSLPPHGDLFVFRMNPPALVQLSEDNRVVHETPVTVPAGCSLVSVSAPPVGTTVALEFECSFGTAVVYVDALTGHARQPVTDSDSHFMAWTQNGQAAYLKVDTMNHPHLVTAPVQGDARYLPITELSYDISPQPGNAGSFLFSFSRGMGLGSEMWHAKDNGQVVQQVTADRESYLSFARWSPDASRIAFIKIADSATPFTVGELWIMQADGSSAHKLADADAGHGFAEDWSPDGTRLAFVVRDNPKDPEADQSAAALQSNIAIVTASNGSESRLTNFKGARVEAPAWSPDGKRIAFAAVLNDTMNVYIADIASGRVEKVLSESACCAVWIRK